MIFISHRGNINGKKTEEENRESYVLEAIELGYDVEVDIWYLPSFGWYLGHDEPQYPTTLEFLKNKKLWIHAKNYEAFNDLTERGYNCFWHQEDDFVLTTTGYIWTYPGKKLGKKSICVLPERYTDEVLFDAYGICSDFIERYRNEYKRT